MDSCQQIISYHYHKTMQRTVHQISASHLPPSHCFTLMNNSCTMLNAVRLARRPVTYPCSQQNCPLPHASTIPDRLTRLPFTALAATLPLLTDMLLVDSTSYIMLKQNNLLVQRTADGFDGNNRTNPDRFKVHHL